MWYPGISDSEPAPHPAVVQETSRPFVGPSRINDRCARRKIVGRARCTGGSSGALIRCGTGVDSRIRNTRNETSTPSIKGMSPHAELQVFDSGNGEDDADTNRLEPCGVRCDSAGRYLGHPGSRENGPRPNRNSGSARCCRTKSASERRW